MKVSIQLSLEISLPGKKIEDVEESFGEAFTQAACEGIGKYIEKRERMLIFKEIDRKERDIRRIFYNRRLKLSYGDVYFKCRQVRDKSGCHHIPILKELGLPPKKKIVLSSYEDILTRCAFATFRKAQAGIKNRLALGTLHQEFQSNTQKEREELLEGLQYLQEVGFSPPPPLSDVARVMDDGIHIRERVLEGRGKGQKEDKRHHMVVQVTRADFGSQNRNDGEGYWSYPPYTYLSVEGESEHIKNGSTLFDAYTGLSRCKSVVHLSDARGNGKKHCREYNENSVWQLDWYHLARHVSVLNKIDKKLRKEVWELIEVERLDDAVSLLENLLESMGSYTLPVEAVSTEAHKNYAKKAVKWWDKRIKDVKDLITYLKNNREGIYGVRKLVGIIPGEHLPFGSGPAERLCGTLVAHRMKGHGKAWKRESASNMLWQINKEFQKMVPENPLIKEACREFRWWKELQEKPIWSSFRVRNSNSNCAFKSGGIQTGSFPILKSARKSRPYFRLLKGISEPKMGLVKL